VSRLLIVDDDPGVVQIFARMLRLSGYDVLTALDGEAALREVLLFHPDALFVDLRMPLVDGVAFLRQLREGADRRTPVAVVTGDYTVDEATEDEVRRLGADLYFKPLWLDDLERIARLLIDKAPEPLPRA
jgi:DNA-binding response OmpR family regulator